GQQTDTASISATYEDDCENSVDLKASDDANYFGAAPSITIKKDVVCDDTGDPLKDGASLLSGDVHYRVTVTNDGNVALAAPDVTDDPAFTTLGDPIESGGDPTLNHNGILDVGETWTYAAVGAWAAGTQSDTATATDSFTDSANNPWSAGVDGKGVTD